MERKLQKKPVVVHLIELRDSFLWVLGFLVAGSIVGYYLYPQLLKIIVSPLNQKIYYTSPVGGFNFTLQVSLLFGILTSLPVLVYQGFRFLSPVLPESIERRFIPFTFLSLVLMLTGVAFAYFIALPQALHFLSRFVSGEVNSWITANDYLSFVTKYFIGFAIIFQLPLILLIINYIIPIRSKKLLSFQRYIIVLAFVLGLILSPAADPFNMTIMALPLIVLYYLSVILIAFVNRKGWRQQRISGFGSERIKNALLFVAIALASGLIFEIILFYLFDNSLISNTLLSIIKK